MESDPRLAAFAELLRVIDLLRDPQGCPWDRAQALRDLSPCVLEEAYEVADALARGDRSQVAAELGDLLMNVLLLARVAQDAGEFSLKEVSEEIAAKLVRRHPHVFGSTEVSGVEHVLRNWEDIKRRERAGSGDASALAGVPVSLPALLRAYRVGEKAARAGFRWQDVGGALAKLDEEVAELKQALPAGDTRHVEEELGDVLFCAVNVARHAGVDAETALRRTTAAFERRFRWIERHAPGPLKELAPAELEGLWRRAKEGVLLEEAGLPEDLPDEWRREVRALVHGREDLFAATRDLPPDVAARVPDPSVAAWSVENILEHLHRVEIAITRALERALAAAGRTGDLPPFPPEGLLAHPPKNVLRLPQERVQAPPAAEGNWKLDRNAAVVALGQSRKDLLALVARLARVHPRHVLAPHPALGELDALQWVEFLALHERRHLEQARRVLKSFESR